jgi:CubicO group peptidase (beta-lactamase class C family)
VLDDGKVVWNDGYGLAKSVSRRAMTVDMRLEAASLGKPITTYAALRLVEAGKLDLCRPLSSYLREQFVKSDQHRDLITTWNVLTHTSGLSNNLLESEHEVAFTPGSQFSYSGVGFMYLQRVIEEVSGAAFDDFITEMIFTPLGMTCSSYSRAGRTAPRGRRSRLLVGCCAPDAIRTECSAECGQSPLLDRTGSRKVRRGADGSHAGEQGAGGADANATGPRREFMVGPGDRPLLRPTVDLLLALGRQTWIFRAI